MEILAIDPGTAVSAWCVWDGERVLAMADEEPNQQLLDRLTSMEFEEPTASAEHMVVEMVQSFGQAVGQEVFETAYWIGRFCEAKSCTACKYSRLFRSEVKMHLCHTMTKVNDAVIRQALIDRFGGSQRAIGGIKCKKCKGKGWFGAKRETCPRCNGSQWDFPPGPLHGVSGDVWQALGLAITWHDLNAVEPVFSEEMTLEGR